MLVFLPVFFLEGLAGSFFRPLALTYVLAIVASLVVALTVTPALCLMLLPGAPLADARLRRSSRGSSAGYRGLLPAMLDRPGRPRWSSLAMLFVVHGARHAAARRGVPAQLPGDDFLMHWVEKPGTSLEAMQRITVRASRELRAIPGVRNFGAHIGRAEVADEVVGPNFTELWISLDPAVPYEPTVARDPGGRGRLPGPVPRPADVPEGADQGGADRRRAPPSSCASTGPTWTCCATKAAGVGTGARDVPGVADLKVEPQVLVPQVEVRLRPEAAQRFGLTPGDVRRAATTLVKGTKVGEVYEGQKIFDVAVWGSRPRATDLASLRDLLIDTPAAARSRSATWPTSPSCRRRTRSSAKTRRAAST